MDDAIDATLFAAARCVKPDICNEYEYMMH